jgi:hypothetical protein
VLVKSKRREEDWSLSSYGEQEGIHMLEALECLKLRMINDRPYSNPIINRNLEIEWAAESPLIYKLEQVEYDKPF